MSLPPSVLRVVRGAICSLLSKQFLQYTGRSPVGRKGTSQSLPQLPQVALCILTGRDASRPPLYPPLKLLFE